MLTYQLSHAQLVAVSKVRPEWVADNLPEWSEEHMAAWMCAHRPTWMFDNNQDSLRKYRPDYLTDDLPKPYGVPEDIAALLGGAA